jgi:peptidoglycan glycosyltransferase
VNAAIRRAAIAVLVGFVLLAFGLVYWQVVRSQSLDSAASNPRAAEASLTEQRGSILDSKGQVIARSVEGADGRLQRVYSDASLAQTIGYVSTRYGLDGLEASYNGYLSGQQGKDPITSIWSDISRQPLRGNDLVLTVDSSLQRVAAQALGQRRGAVVALDPRTGAVRAIVSAPGYDPNKLDALGSSLLQDPDKPLLNRVTQGLYPPGSTYKTVTATAALDSGVVKPSDIYKCVDGIVIRGFPIACTNAPPGETEWDFLHAYAYSINATFAQVALQIGAGRFTDYSHRFGLGDSQPFDIDVATSLVAQPGNNLNDVLLASSGFGQGQLAVTPLQMALVAATVANNGVEPSPYLVAQVRDADGNVVSDRHPDAHGEVMRAQTAATMKEFMSTAVAIGFGREAGLAGLDVAGKTGTAETGGSDAAHAWFIGFAPVSAPRIAVAVIVENGGSGGITAGPIAAQIFKSVLGK